MHPYLTKSRERTRLKSQHVKRLELEKEVIMVSGWEIVAMCEAEIGKGCEHPEKLKGKVGKCSPEQIRECHGDVEEHPCVEEKKQKHAD